MENLTAAVTKSPDHDGRVRFSRQLNSSIRMAFYASRSLRLTKKEDSSSGISEDRNGHLASQIAFAKGLQPVVSSFTERIPFRRRTRLPFASALAGGGEKDSKRGQALEGEWSSSSLSTQLGVQSNK